MAHVLDLPDLVVSDHLSDNLPFLSYYRERLIANVSYAYLEFPYKAALFGIVSNARIFIFPSTVEAMSMALLEAASFGVPIVCSDIPANKAVLPKDALYFRSGDIKDIERQLRWALGHPDEMKEMGIHAQATVQTQFSWDRIVEQYDEIYRAVGRKNY